ncbi:MAG: carbohydrate kinase family protein [Desulfurococcaceae archaeon TW002]
MIDLLCVGHALVDIRFLVDKFPQPDEEARILDEKRSVGGSAANVAIGARRLGLQTGLIAKVGLDSFGRMIVDELMSEGVDISGVKISTTLPTGFSVVVRDSEGRILIYGFKGASEDLGIKDVDKELLLGARYVHIASLRPDTTLGILKLLENGNKPVVSWDPGRVLALSGLSKLKPIISQVDIVSVNKREAFYITGESDYVRAAEELRRLGPKIVIIKKGSEGVYLVSDSVTVDMPAFPPEKIVDTTGAGDAFMAGFYSALRRDYDLEEAVRYAVVVASIKVSRLGSHEVPRHEEVIRVIKSAHKP